MTDTTTKEGRLQRLALFVEEYARRHNWSAITRLIGGSPRYDLQDIDDCSESASHPDERYNENTLQKA